MPALLRRVGIAIGAGRVLLFFNRAVCEYRLNRINRHAVKNRRRRGRGSADNTAVRDRSESPRIPNDDTRENYRRKSNQYQPVASRVRRAIPQTLQEGVNDGRIVHGVLVAVSESVEPSTVEPTINPRLACQLFFAS